MDNAHPCLHLIHMLSALSSAAEGFKAKLHILCHIRQLFQHAHVNIPILPLVLGAEWAFAYPKYAALQLPHIFFCLEQNGRIPTCIASPDTLDQAETQLAEAERQKAEYTQQLASARGEAAHIVEEARKRADLAYSRRMDEAAQDVQRLNEQAARQRAADREAMLASAQKQVADLVLLTTAKVSQRTLDADADRAMLDALLEEVGDE